MFFFSFADELTKVAGKGFNDVAWRSAVERTTSPGFRESAPKPAPPKPPPGIEKRTRQRSIESGQTAPYLPAKVQAQEAFNRKAGTMMRGIRTTGRGLLEDVGNSIRQSEAKRPGIEATRIKRDKMVQNIRSGWNGLGQTTAPGMGRSHMRKGAGVGFSQGLAKSVMGGAAKGVSPPKQKPVSKGPMQLQKPPGYQMKGPMAQNAPAQYPAAPVKKPDPTKPITFNSPSGQTGVTPGGRPSDVSAGGSAPMSGLGAKGSGSLVQPPRRQAPQEDIYAKRDRLFKQRNQQSPSSKPKPKPKPSAGGDDIFARRDKLFKQRQGQLAQDDILARRDKLFAARNKRNNTAPRVTASKAPKSRVTARRSGIPQFPARGGATMSTRSLGDQAKDQ